MKSSFTVFGITMYPYTIFMIAGAFLCFGIFCLLTFRRHRNMANENVFVLEMFIVSIAAALPAAMLFDSLFKWGETGNFQLGGATFYGGLIGALILFPLLLLFKKARQVSIFERLCDLAPAIPAGHCIGRIGCFFGGCCFGAPTDCIFGVIFPQGSLPYEFYGGEVSVHPTQLYEAAFLLALFVFLIIFKKEHAFPFYFIFYGAARFLIEFLRADDRGTIFGLPISPAQVISIILVIIGIGMEIYRFIRCRNPKSQIE